MTDQALQKAFTLKLNVATFKQVTLYNDCKDTKLFSTDLAGEGELWPVNSFGYVDQRLDRGR